MVLGCGTIRLPARVELALLFEAPARVGQQGDVPGALDRAGQHALVPGACAGLAPRADLAFVGDEAPQHIGLLVVDADSLVGAELAGLGACIVAALAAAHALTASARAFRAATTGGAFTTGFVRSFNSHSFLQCDSRGRSPG